jgi:hypothetical protein
MTSRPRATCPLCGRQITGRLRDGKIVLRRHVLAPAGTRASNYGDAIWCKGSGRAADLSPAPSPDRED